MANPDDFENYAYDEQGRVLKICLACGETSYSYAYFLEVCDDKECERDHQNEDRCLYLVEDMG